MNRCRVFGTAPMLTCQFERSSIPWHQWERPLQMKVGLLRGEYRLGFNPFSGTSSISFADCAHAMLGMLQDDTWLGKAPIVQY